MAEDLYVITFPITYYSFETLEYIKQLPEEVLYQEINGGYTPDILTAILGRIITIEYDAYYRIRTFPNLLEQIPNNWILEQVANTCPNALLNRDKFQLPVLYDIFQRDFSLFNYLNLFFPIDVVNNPQVFILIKNGKYTAHVYAWSVTMDISVTNVIGIRSSLLELMNNVCNKKISGIGTILINSIYNWTRDLTDTDNYIRVIHPIGPMPTILERYGFIKVGDNNIPWIDNYLGNTLLLEKGKGLRQSDYIMRVI